MQNEYVCDLKTDALFAFYSDNSEKFPIPYNRIDLYFLGACSENLESRKFCSNIICAGFFYCDVSKDRLVNYYFELCDKDFGMSLKFKFRFDYIVKSLPSPKLLSQDCQMSLFSDKESLEKMYIPLLRVIRKGEWNHENKTGCAITYGLSNGVDLNKPVCPFCGKMLRNFERSYSKYGRNNFYNCDCGHLAKISFRLMAYKEILAFRLEHGLQKGLSL